MATNPGPDVNPQVPPAGATKFFLRSKTILSALLMALPQILGAFDIRFTDGDAQLWVERVSTVLGLLGIVWGRHTASGGIHFGTGAAPAALIAVIATAFFGGCATMPAVQVTYRGTTGGVDYKVGYDGKAISAELDARGAK